jgi:hypothetical protein
MPTGSDFTKEALNERAQPVPLLELNSTWRRYDQARAITKLRSMSGSAPMSVLPPLATVIATCTAVAKGQEQTKCIAAENVLFDYLVGA